MFVYITLHLSNPDTLRMFDFFSGAPGNSIFLEKANLWLSTVYHTSVANSPFGFRQIFHVYGHRDREVVTGDPLTLRQLSGICDMQAGVYNRDAKEAQDHLALWMQTEQLTKVGYSVFDARNKSADALFPKLLRRAMMVRGETYLDLLGSASLEDRVFLDEGGSVWRTPTKN